MSVCGFTAFEQGLRHLLVIFLRKSTSLSKKYCKNRGEGGVMFTFLHSASYRMKKLSFITLTGVAYPFLIE